VGGLLSGLCSRKIRTPNKKIVIKGIKVICYPGLFRLEFLDLHISEQPTYSHLIKIEDTAKGIKLSDHIYSNSSGEAIEHVSQTYLKANITAIDNKIQLALVEAEKKF
jgi:hypothetical protein